MCLWRGGDGAFDEHFAGLGYEVLVQEPQLESLPPVGGHQILCEVVKAVPVILGQNTDIGGVHVGEFGVVTGSVIADG
jgi:hypothetical protein